MRLWFYCALLLSALFLSGCGPALKARVTSFHDPVIEPKGQTFVVVPLDHQRSSLEFQSYAGVVEDLLEERGYDSAPFKQARYAVFLHYAIDSGQSVSYSYPIFGRTGVSSASTYGTYDSYGYSGTTTYTPTYGVVGAGTGTSIQYQRQARVVVFDAQSFLDGQSVRVYEGQVTSVGSTGQLQAVLPTMLKALLERFLGKDGQTRQVTRAIEP